MLRFQPQSLAASTFVNTNANATSVDKSGAAPLDAEIDDDEIDMSALEELMEDLSMEEEIDDTVSISAVKGYLSNNTR